MSVLHILSGGTVGGIEVLCKEYGLHSVNDNIFVILWNDGPIVTEMREAGLKVITLNAPKKDVLGTFRKLVLICKEYQVSTTVVHHAAPVAHAYMLLLKRRFPEMKTVGYAHGNAHDMCPSDKKFLYIRKKIISLSLKNADHVVAISESVKNSCIEYFNTPSEKISVIYNGVDVSKFHPKDKMNESSVVKLIYVGRLMKNKGVQNILKGLTQLPSNFSYEFLVIGDGPYRTELEKYVNENNLPHVCFRGEIRNIIPFLQESDVFIHIPVWEEGFGITVIEAMATGLVCICGNKGALPEIITHRENGFLVNDDKKAVADAIVKYSQLSREEKLNLKNNSIIRAQDFSIELFVNELDSILL